IPAPGIAAAVCSVPGQSTSSVQTLAPVSQFQLREEITATSPIVVRLTELLRDLGIQIAGVEFIETVDGRQVVYDINTNTNYNPDVEREVEAFGGLRATRRIAQFIGGKLG